MSLQGAILDDYQNVSQTVADWSGLAKDVNFKVFNEPLGGPDKVIAALKSCAIVCLMRERTLFGKDVIDALPNLKLIVTSGMRNAAIDIAAAAARGIPVCGTESLGPPTAELTFGLMLELARKMGIENARLKAGARWQSTLGIDLYGKTLGIIGLGKLGTRVARIANAMDMKVIAWSQNLTAEKAQGRRRHAGQQRGAAAAVRFRHHPCAAVRAHQGPDRRGGIGADEADRLFHQHLARADGRREGDRGGAAAPRKSPARPSTSTTRSRWRSTIPFRKLDNIVITPHLGYVTAENYKRFYGHMVEDIRAWLDGKPVRVIPPK